MMCVFSMSCDYCFGWGKRECGSIYLYNEQILGISEKCMPPNLLAAKLEMFEGTSLLLLFFWQYVNTDQNN